MIDLRRTKNMLNVAIIVKIAKDGISLSFEKYIPIYHKLLESNILKKNSVVSVWDTLMRSQCNETVKKQVKSQLLYITNIWPFYLQLKPGRNHMAIKADFMI